MSDIVEISHGAHMAINSRDQLAHIQAHWIAGVFYEQGMLDYIRSNYSGGTFVDIGSSIGNHTVYFGLFCNPDTIYSFEPVRLACDHQWQNIGLNELLNKDIRVYACAIGDESCRGTMQLPTGGNEGTWMFMKDPNGVTPMFTLDMFKLSNVSLIKIDAEGYEPAILNSGLETIKKYRPVIFAEAKKESDLQNIMDILGPVGYVPGHRFNFTPTYEFICQGEI